MNILQRIGIGVQAMGRFEVLIEFLFRNERISCRKRAIEFTGDINYCCP